MSDDPVTTCPVCEAAVERVFHPVAVHFKGSGFYSTDYGRKRAGVGAAGEDSGSGDSGNGAKGDSTKGDSTKGDAAKSDSAGGESAKKSDTKSKSGD